MMKRNVILCVLVLSLLLLAGCAQQQSQMSYIGADAAKQAALADCGLTVSGVDTITADLSSRGGKDYYRIDITAAGQTYQYDVDALTGIVIEARTPDAVLAETEADGWNGANQTVSQQTDIPAGSDQTASTGSSPSGADQNASTSSTSGAVQNTSAGSSTSSDLGQTSGANASGGSQGASSAAVISAEDARSSALTHAGVTAGQATFGKCKLEYDDGRQVYDIEFYTQNNEEYDYEIDAYTGEVISFDYEVKGHVADSSSGSAITEEQAKELALAQVPGAAAENIREFEVDYEDGRTEYEGKIVYDGIEYEFEIDGYSGAIRSWEAEPVSR